MAKLFGVDVPEFGFGYPPRLFSKKIGKTIYSINAIPFGGFARIKGLDSGEPGAGDPDSFVSQTKVKRTLIICGGIFGNIVLAWLLFIVLSVIGNPIPANKVLVEGVAAGSPAESAGIIAGDHVVTFAGEQVTTADELVALITKNVGRSTEMEIEHAGEIHLVTAVPRAASPSGEGPLGVSIITGTTYQKVSLWRAPFTAFREVVVISREMIRVVGQLFGSMFQGKAVDVGGPVAVFALTETYSSYGVRIFLQFIALLSLNFFIFNLLPFPALDGGRLVFIAYEAIWKRRAPVRMERFVNNFGFTLLIILSVVIAVKDIKAFF